MMQSDCVQGDITFLTFGTWLIVLLLLSVYFLAGGGVPVVGRMVQLVLLFLELWWRSKESGKTLSYTKVAWLII